MWLKATLAPTCIIYVNLDQIGAVKLIELSCIMANVGWFSALIFILFKLPFVNPTML